MTMKVNIAQEIVEKIKWSSHLINTWPYSAIKNIGKLIVFQAVSQSALTVPPNIRVLYTPVKL